LPFGKSRQNPLVRQNMTYICYNATFAMQKPAKFVPELLFFVPPAQQFSPALLF